MKEIKTEVSLERDAQVAKVNELEEQLKTGEPLSDTNTTDKDKQIASQAEEIKTLTNKVANNTSSDEGDGAAGGFVAGGITFGTLGYFMSKARRKKRLTGAYIGKAKIKGSVASDGTKIYHMPEDRFYSSVVIDTKQGEKYFKKETDAMTDGFRRADV